MKNVLIHQYANVPIVAMRCGLHFPSFRPTWRNLIRLWIAGSRLDCPGSTLDRDSSTPLRYGQNDGRRRGLPAVASTVPVPRLIEITFRWSVCSHFVLGSSTPLRYGQNDGRRRGLPAIFILAYWHIVNFSLHLRNNIKTETL